MRMETGSGAGGDDDSPPMVASGYQEALAT